MISVDVQTQGVVDFLDQFSKQGRKAISIALNRTGELADIAAGEEIKRNMIVRVPGFILPPRTIPNDYRATPDKLFVKVDIAYGDDPGSIAARRRGILSKFEAGGTKSTTNPNYPVAIPTDALRPSPHDLVARSLYPRNLVGQFNSRGEFQGLGRNANTKTRLKKLKGSGEIAVYRKQVGRYFVLGQLGEKTFGVYERFGPGKGDIRKLWQLRQSIPIPATLHYQDTIQRVVDERFAPELMAAMERYVP